MSRSEYLRTGHRAACKPALSPEQLRRIPEMREQRLTLAEIAHEFGVSRATVTKAWKRTREQQQASVAEASVAEASVAEASAEQHREV